MTCWDLHSNRITAPMLSTMFGQMQNAFMRLGWIVSDLTQEELEYRGPNGDLNSIATLLWHIPCADAGWLYLARGQEIPDEYTEEGPDGNLPVITGRTAQELLDRYQVILDQWEQYLMTQTDDDLHRPIQHAPEAVATLRWALWHVAEHNIGHQNQMVWLKRWVRHSKA